jgi:hypothetical protein
MDNKKNNIKKNNNDVKLLLFIKKGGVNFAIFGCIIEKQLKCKEIYQTYFAGTKIILLIHLIYH